MRPGEFLREIVRPYIVETVKELRTKDELLPTRIGVIDGKHVSGSGLPRVRFEGEDDASSRTYPILGYYSPTAEDRVLMVRAGRTWVVLGRISEDASVTATNLSTIDDASIGTDLMVGNDLIVDNDLDVSGDVSGAAFVGTSVSTTGGVTADGTVTAADGDPAEVAIGRVGPLTASGLALLNGASRIWASVAGRLQMDIIEPEAVWSHGTVEAEAGEAGEVAIGNVGPLLASGVTFRNGGSVLWAPTNGKVQTEDLQCAELIFEDGSVSGNLGVTGGILAGGINAGQVESGTFDTGSGHDFTINNQGEDPALNNWTPDAESSAYAGIGDFNVYAAVVDLNQLRAAYENLRLAHVETQKFCNAMAAHLKTIGLFQ